MFRLVLLVQFQFNSIQFYCKIGMTERSQWTEYINQVTRQQHYTHILRQFARGHETGSSSWSVIWPWWVNYSRIRTKY